MNILITGASGFIGKPLFEQLSAKHQVTGLSRTDFSFCHKSPDIDDEDAWLETIGKSDVIIHCAGRAHILNDTADDPLEKFRIANVDFSIKLANYSIKKNVRRFVFFSSLGVNGSETGDTAFSENMSPSPIYEYAVSKLEAEEKLKTMFAHSDTELVIIRPPLVYAYNAPGNFERLLKLAKIGVPLPFLGINNKRSLISIKNLVNFVECCCEHPKAANETFLVADNEVVSTADILNYLNVGMGKSKRVFYFPKIIISNLFKVFGLGGIYHKMFSNLEVSNLKAKEILGWSPIETSFAALEKTGKQYINMDK